MPFPYDFPFYFHGTGTGARGAYVVFRGPMRVLVYESYSDLTLLDELTERITSMAYTTALHGGFKSCTIRASITLAEGLLYLRRGNLPGRHFKHLQVLEGHQTRWEGRIMPIELAWSRDQVELSLTALGYWSSCRDQRVAVVDYSGGSNTVDSIIKAMLTAECPDISSDQSNIDAAAGAVNLTLAVDTYAQDHIIQALAPLGDSDDNTYDFAIWEDRVPYYAARAVTAVDWEIPLYSIDQGRITQDPAHLRNAADSYDGTTRTAAASDTDSQARYPVRDAVVDVPTGTTAARALDARDRYVSEHKDPQQESTFSISGPVYRRQQFGPEPGGRSAIRAGDVVRITGLTPIADTASLDNLRTFFVVDTSYDALSDVVRITPDRPASTLSVFLARQGVEVTR